MLNTIKKILWREGTYLYLWLIHVDIWQKTTKFCKAIILQLKNFKNQKKKKKKLNIKYINIMVSRPNTSWQIDGGKVETVTDFIFLGSKITADSDCSHEIKRSLLLGRKAMTNLDSTLKSTLLTKVHIFKAMVFSAVNVWIWEFDHKNHKVRL